MEAEALIALVNKSGELQAKLAEIVDEAYNTAELLGMDKSQLIYGGLSMAEQKTLILRMKSLYVHLLTELKEFEAHDFDVMVKAIEAVQNPDA